MESMRWGSSELRQYLLGDVSEEVKTGFDLQLLTDQEFMTAVEVAEEELIDDYLDENLTPDELNSFMLFFLNSPQRAEQIELSRQLKNYAGQNAVESATGQPGDAEPRGFLNRLRDRYLSPLRPAFAIPGLAILLLLLLGISYLIQNRIVGTPGPGEDEVAQINLRDLSNLSEYASLTRLTLVSEATRDSTELRTISLGTASELILIRLALPPGISGDSIHVKISNNNVLVTTLENIRVYANQAGRDVRILMPRAKLDIGRYMVEVSEGPSTTAQATYVFDIRP